MTIGIFGNTQQIPDPRFVYQTTYPNRFRGSYWAIPRFGLPFVPNPTWGPPFAGLGGCGCAGMADAGGARSEDFAGLGVTFSEVNPQAPTPAPSAPTYSAYTDAIVTGPAYAARSLVKPSSGLSTGAGMAIGAALVGVAALVIYTRK